MKHKHKIDIKSQSQTRLKLASIDQVLNFLQLNYKLFSSKDNKIQDLECVNNNKIIKDESLKVNASQSNSPPLRLLYIDLMLHDQLLLESKNLNIKDTKNEKIKRKKAVEF